jgi:hypothetical protein
MQDKACGYDCHDQQPYEQPGAGNPLLTPGQCLDLRFMN